MCYNNRMVDFFIPDSPTPICAECGGEMELRLSRYKDSKGRKRLVFKCKKLGCKGTHAAHPDGTPCGIPGDKQTKRWRVTAHEYFDRLWKPSLGGKMSRTSAYNVLQKLMGMSKDEAHISKFDIEQCKQCITKIKEYLGSNKTLVDIFQEGGLDSF